ncbi:SPX domain-containing protein 2-like [Andrographis paniculata]|uniref:SPX domain-containing protein 2-like n=1 Tax=Andrographis paniculata TaxID=175694 RepID=UPI0021E77822|nr:SPX domain-containing protein 2-like [Andrographis paniculata]
MKFWKILRKLLDETFPDWQEMFISYKDLKKQLKLISPKTKSKHLPRVSKRPKLGEEEEEEEVVVVVSPEMKDFLKLLEGEIKKFNAFFLDKEEEYVIRFKLLKDGVAEAKEEELMKVGRKLVDFHGEMILLENYSVLNYTGLVKILKKYDKRSGNLIQLPFIQKVLQEPFFRTEVINKLVKECEGMIHCIFSRQEQQLVISEGAAASAKQRVSEVEVEKLRVPEELAEIKSMENMYLKLTISALQTLKEMRSGSSTVNMFSLPPLRS